MISSFFFFLRHFPVFSFNFTGARETFDAPKTGLDSFIMAELFGFAIGFSLVTSFLQEFANYKCTGIIVLERLQ